MIPNKAKHEQTESTVTNRWVHGLDYDNCRETVLSVRLGDLLLSA